MEFKNGVIKFSIQDGQIFEGTITNAAAASATAVGESKIIGKLQKNEQCNEYSVEITPELKSAINIPESVNIMINNGFAYYDDGQKTKIIGFAKLGQKYDIIRADNGSIENMPQALKYNGPRAILPATFDLCFFKELNYEMLNEFLIEAGVLAEGKHFSDADFSNWIFSFVFHMLEAGEMKISYIANKSPSASFCYFSSIRNFTNSDRGSPLCWHCEHSTNDNSSFSDSERAPYYIVLNHKCAEQDEFPNENLIKMSLCYGRNDQEKKKKKIIDSLRNKLKEEQIKCINHDWHCMRYLIKTATILVRDGKLETPMEAVTTDIGYTMIADWTSANILHRTNIIATSIDDYSTLAKYNINDDGKQSIVQIYRLPTKFSYLSVAQLEQALYRMDRYRRYLWPMSFCLEEIMKLTSIHQQAVRIMQDSGINKMFEIRSKNETLDQTFDSIAYMRKFMRTNKVDNPFHYDRGGFCNRGQSELENMKIFSSDFFSWAESKLTKHRTEIDVVINAITQQRNMTEEELIARHEICMDEQSEKIYIKMKKDVNLIFLK